MKQNERLLVYAVTGFLALILVIAVVFGNESNAGAKKQDNGLQNLSDLLSPNGGGKPGQAGPGVPGSLPGDGPAGGTGALGGSAGAPQHGLLSGILSPSAIVPEQPLVAKSQIAADVVAQHLGQSRRDRDVRIVRARAGDSLEKLVRRWCGARDPFLEDATYLNEQLRTIAIGQEVTLPWVADETLLALIELQAPRTLTAAPGGGDVLPLHALAGDVAGGGSASGNSGRIGLMPEFALPGGAGAGAGAEAGGAGAGEAAPPIAGTSAYTVVAGDSLWKIAAKKYGKKNADRLVREILALNPGLSEDLKVGQKFQLPAAQ